MNPSTPSPSGPAFDSKTVEQVSSLLNDVLQTGIMPASLPKELTDTAQLIDLIDKLAQIQRLVLSIANGNLDFEIRMRGKVAGALKSLQANLRHLTWQTQQIASGDMTQRVVFMGEFADAFNIMVEQIAQSREVLQKHALELAEQRQTALKMMEEATAAHAEAEKANLQLKEQLLENQALQQQLREQATRDPLTGCFNRRYMTETLTREFARARRDAYPISIIMIDIDRFKSINDTYGHTAGDDVLVALGHMLQTSTRQSDMVTRYGGEEFLLMLPNMPKEIAVIRAEEIRLAFAALPVTSGEVTITCTLCAGVATYPQDGQNELTLIDKADQSLYQAKQTGRNRVVAYS